MKINDEFRNYQVNTEKLLSYGFQKDGEAFLFQKEDPKNHLKITLKISGSDFDVLVWDTDFDEEAIGTLSNPTIKESWMNLVEDIRKNCYEEVLYNARQSLLVNDYIKKKYDVDPEFLFSDYPHFGVYRNKENDKWFSLIMPVTYKTLKIDKPGNVEVLNVKSEKVEELLKQKGFLPAYHMSKKNWITIPLDESIPDDLILKTLDESYIAVDTTKKKQKKAKEIKQ